MSVFADPGSRSYARVAGALYLLIAISGGFAIAFVPAQLYVPGDLAASVQSLIDARGMFLAGIAGDVTMMVSELLVTPMLFFMFRSINPTLSLAAALARLTMVTTMAVMLMFHAAMLAFADGSALTAFSGEERMQLAGVMLYAHDSGVWVWQIFFSLHLWLLGALILKSGLFPRLLGLGLIVGGAGYILDSAFAFAFPEVAALGLLRAVLLGIVTLSEIGFALWLLIKGPRQV
ncbi:DUF4386 domain-containing protein [Marivita geojedonensis]|uniref:DUF4386 domain-containing protein n=1 Tax=Marivita geojedonensis TaxID=1123756 RepID=A0A1X4N7I9_9RHOB|nr:DUF4386 domain-containing protein [Marivita geojedonensis]OSQ42169.1 hypothetical protein MGEO_20725 [Marivita geojedonensis]PRY70897.1 uncharacterized protein DUF4386 [Marivita geojedonensis]